MIKYIVSIGDAFSGLTLYGPFDTWEAAAEFDDTIEDSDHCIVRLQEPPQVRS